MESAEEKRTGIPEGRDFRVMGIGQSAGCLNSLLAFFPRLPSDPEMGFEFIHCLHNLSLDTTRGLFDASFDAVERSMNGAFGPIGVYGLTGAGDFVMAKRRESANANALVDGFAAESGAQRDSVENRPCRSVRKPPEKDVGRLFLPAPPSDRGKGESSHWFGPSSRCTGGSRGPERRARGRVAEFVVRLPLSEVVSPNAPMTLKPEDR